MGATCFTNFTRAVRGVQSRSARPAMVFSIAALMIARKSAARSAGSATMSTVPSSADAIARSSSTRQSVPTPRQSQVNRPTTASSADWNTPVDSPFWPSVSRMAWRRRPG